MKEDFAGGQGAREFLHPVRILFAIFVFSFVSSLFLGAAVAQGNSSLHESGRAAQVRALNNNVLQLHGQLQENASGAGTVRSQAATVLAQRAAALQTLMQREPRAALTFAFSPDLLADLAAKFPASASVLESHVTLSGTVEHWVADAADLKSSKESWFLNAGGSRLELHFGTAHLGASSGPVVTIEGVQLGSHVAVSKVTSTPLSGSFVIPNGVFGGRNLSSLLALLLVGILLAAARKLSVRAARQASATLLRQLAVCAVALVFFVSSPLVASAQTCTSTGVQNVAVLLVSFSDKAVAVTPQQASYDFFGGNDGPSLAGYWQEVSYGQTSATGNVFGPLTIGESSSYSCSTISQVFYDAVTAAHAQGIDLTSYHRISIILPDLNCGWAGFTTGLSGSAGCLTWSTAEGTLTASLSYDSDKYFTTQAQAVELVAHENGHQLGLEHSGTITDEPTAVLGPLSGPGTITEFNDFFSIMGAWTLGHYTAPDKAEILNWITPAVGYDVVSSSGTYTLQPVESSPAGLKALKIQRGTGNNGYYLWVEYRQPVGYDSSKYAYLGFMNYNGALIHYETPNLASFGSYNYHQQVLDFTPSDIGSWYKTVLAPGQTWTDPDTDLSLSVVSATSAGLTVSVSYSGSTSSCISSAPSLSLSPSNPSLYAGQSASYTVSLTDNDSSSCSPNTFTFSPALPSGWSSSFSSSLLSLRPGQSGTVTLTVSAPSSAAPGTYPVSLTTSDSTKSATGTANTTVITAPSLAISVSISGTSFTPPTTVPISAAVTSGGLPASGASVTFKLMAPNGTTATQSATTGSNGVATWNYKLNSKSPAGSYSVVAQASLSSGGSGGKKTAAASSLAVSSNTATFSVQ